MKIIIITILALAVFIDYRKGWGIFYNDKNK